MKKRSETMKNRMMRLLSELLKDSKRSDRELAKVLGVSQPTISRMRWRLVEEGMIKAFTVVPDFVEMGYEIMAISFFRSKRTKDTTERAMKWTKAKPNIIFAAGAQGMRKNAVIISLHESYTEFSKFFEEIMAEGHDVIEEFDTLFISLEGRIVKPFSLTYLGEQEET